jgi:hypothetical protein
MAWTDAAQVDGVVWSDKQLVLMPAAATCWWAAHTMVVLLCVLPPMRPACGALLLL